jgi:hypothetical protein
MYGNCNTEHTERAASACRNRDMGLNVLAPTVFRRQRLKRRLKEEAKMKCELRKTFFL